MCQVIVSEGATDNMVIPLQGDECVREVARIRQEVEAQPFVFSVISVLYQGHLTEERKRGGQRLIVVLKKGYDANEVAVTLRRVLTLE